MEIKVVAGPGAFESILPIFHEYWEESPEWRGREPYSAIEVWRMQCHLGMQCTDPLSIILVAVEDENICGFVKASLDRGNSLKEGIGAIIEDFYVAKSHRGKNTATVKLWSMVNKWAKNMSADYVDADISHKNDSAIKLMKSRGFTPLWSRYRKIIREKEDGQRSNTNAAAAAEPSGV
jgi:GNAT superfamily N-acetyltransferase